MCPFGKAPKSAAAERAPILPPFLSQSTESWLREAPLTDDGMDMDMDVPRRLVANLPPSQNPIYRVPLKAIAFRLAEKMRLKTTEFHLYE